MCADWAVHCSAAVMHGVCVCVCVCAVKYRQPNMMHFLLKGSLVQYLCVV